LRHATDPDHLTAVSTLVLTDEAGRTRRAAVLGLAWGAGHATTLLLFGLPVVLLQRYLPEPVQQASELAVGVLIVALAIRLLVRWRRGYLHVHVHSHGAVRHAHPHVHEHGVAHQHPAEDHHEHPHAEALGRSPLAAYGIGLVHGIGGSAGVGILLIGGISNGATAVFALALFAVATALSMSAMSAGFGYALARGPVVRIFERLAPVLGVVSLAFGTAYMLSAVQALPPLY
jgi:ABC-type nickel/cobalt efflux system permease component RcnA